MAQSDSRNPLPTGVRLFRRRVWPDSPLVGAVADTGQIARLAASAGIHFLLALSAGVYRSQGVTALAAGLPFRNSNDLTEALVRDQVLPASGAVPVVAGLMASDPACPVSDRIDRLRSWGVMGLTTYPSVTLIDGSLRTIFEEQGCTVEAEAAMLREARRQGLSTLAFVGADPEAARTLAASGVDGLILTPGPTQVLDDFHDRRDRLQHAVRQLNATLDAARQERPELPCLVFGGPITGSDDLEQVYRQSALDGFVGGSVFARFPVEAAVTGAIRKFQGVAIPPEGRQPSGLGPMIGTTPPMRELFRLIRKAAACDLNVCVEGESGVGKELVATHLHRLSGRAHGALVTLNCGAIPESLLESELFGHERGAFTGADRRRLGKFELANNGTLFLDEVGDLSPRGQVALLRAIQQREITRVGGNTAIPVNTRIVAASNQPLATLVEERRFRADLYYRLNNLTLAVPPLRQRLDDLPLLVVGIVASLRLEMNRELLDLSPSFYDKLRRHGWPGNLRELQHVIAQAALLEEGAVLEGRHFNPVPHDARGPATRPAEGSLLERVETALRDERRTHVEEALRETGGNKSRAAARLGVSRKTLYAWLAELESEGVNPPEGPSTPRS